MKNIKYLGIFILLLAGGMFMQSCNKDKDVTTDVQGTEVQFSIQQTGFTGFKDFDPGNVPMCSDLSMDYVVFTLDGVTDAYTSPVLTANGKLLTQAIKLYTGNYTLTSFLVYHDVAPLGNNDGGEDILVRAAPSVGSTYHDLMVHPLNITFSVEAFKKKEIEVDVLCFEDLFYDEFGFTWFEMNLVKIERQCFFGDVCTGKLWQFENSAYAATTAGLQTDMPAIMQIEVYKGETLIRTFDNMGDFHWDATVDNGDGTYGAYLGFNGEGACMEVYWANDEDLEEEFTFILSVWLPQGSTFEWVPMKSWTFLDDNCPDPGSDGVVDFEVGECSVGGGADFTFPAWVNLPSDVFQLELKSGGNLTSGVPASLGTYLNIELSGITGGPYDIKNGLVGSFCGQSQVYIYYNYEYDVKVVNSTQPMPQILLNQLEHGENYTPERLASINWLINNLHTYPDWLNVDLEDWTNNEAGLWADFQRGLWYMLDVPGGAVYPWATDALTHTTFTPLPGEFTMDIFYCVEDADDTPGAGVMQFMIVLVDP